MIERKMMDAVNQSGIDIRTELPPTQAGKTLEIGSGDREFSCFGFSRQGDSHKKMKDPVPCQDYNDFRVLEGSNVLIAAIADGVGSCPLAHWGAFVAVEEALESIEKSIRGITEKKHLNLTEHEDEVKNALNQAFIDAMNGVEDVANAQGCPPTAMHSTLTLVVYDGKVLYCEHAGDDGVVVQFMNGSVAMLTRREKGQEANSVYPLQSRQWSISKAGASDRGPVVAFLMATDGVLDAFVADDSAPLAMGEEFLQRWRACTNGIDYRFMRRSVYDENGKPRRAEEGLEYYLSGTDTTNYRKRVTDDLTVVSVINAALVRKGKKPAFNEEEFKALQMEIVQWQRKGLYTDRETSNATEKALGTTTEERATNSIAANAERNPTLDHRERSNAFSGAGNKKILVRLVGLVQKTQVFFEKFRFQSILVLAVLLAFLAGFLLKGMVNHFQKEKEEPTVQIQEYEQSTEQSVEPPRPNKTEEETEQPPEENKEELFPAQEDSESLEQEQTDDPVLESTSSAEAEPQSLIFCSDSIERGGEEPQELGIGGVKVDGINYFLFREFCMAYYELNNEEYVNRGLNEKLILDELVQDDRYYSISDIVKTLELSLSFDGETILVSEPFRHQEEGTNNSNEIDNQYI